MTTINQSTKNFFKEIINNCSLEDKQELLLYITNNISESPSAEPFDSDSDSDESVMDEDFEPVVDAIQNNIEVKKAMYHRWYLILNNFPKMVSESNGHTLLSVSPEEITWKTGNSTYINSINKNGEMKINLDCILMKKLTSVLRKDLKDKMKGEGRINRVFHIFDKDGVNRLCPAFTLVDIKIKYALVEHRVRYTRERLHKYILYVIPYAPTFDTFYDFDIDASCAILSYVEW